MDNLENFLGEADMMDGNKMLGHILGQDRNMVENTISASTGLGNLRKKPPYFNGEMNFLRHHM